MAHQSRVSQDRRLVSRVPALLECQFSDGGRAYRAVIVNLSLDGAFLSAKHLPSKDAEISIRISPPGASAPLVLRGKVLRGAYGTSEVGILGRFGVKFSTPPIELMILLQRLAQKGQTKTQGESTPAK